MISVSDKGQIYIDEQESNFKIQEFIPKTVWELREHRRPKWFIQPEVIKLAQFYRDWWGVPVHINNWHVGGTFNLRGFREPHVGLVKHVREELTDEQADRLISILRECDSFDKEKLTIGSWLSQHKFGKAFDCTVEGMTADETRQEIRDNEAEFMEAGLTTLETGKFAPTWVHSDVRFTGLDSIFMVGV